MAHSSPDLGVVTRARQLRARVAKVKARRASTKPPAFETKANSRRTYSGRTSDATGPCAGVLHGDTGALLDPLIQLQVQLGSTTDSNLYAGFSQDVTRGGVFICTHEHLELIQELGRRVAVTMTFPGGEQTRALGLVRFARDEFDAVTGNSPGLGIQFLALTDEGHRLIHRFASHREPMFFVD